MYKGTKSIAKYQSKPTQKSRCSQRSNSKYETKKSVTGGQFKIPSSPPGISSKPWNRLTLVKIDKKINEFYLSELKAAFMKQLDEERRVIKEDPEIQVQLHSIKLWNLTGRAISLTPYDYTTRVSGSSDTKRNQDQLGGFTSVASITEVPRLAYAWPDHLQNETLDFKSEGASGSTSDVYLAFITAGDTDEICMHVSISWRFPGPAIYAQIDTTTDLISQRLLNVSDRLSSWEKKFEESGPTVTHIPLIGRGLDVNNLIPIPIDDRLAAIEKKLEKITLSGESVSSYEEVHDEA